MHKYRLPQMLTGLVAWLLSSMIYIEVGRAEDHPAFLPVKKLFAAMSTHDGKAMRATTTADFQLLEHGEEWTMQMLVKAVQPNGKPYERKNFFQQIRASEIGNMAWVSYWNKAEIRREGKLRTIVWLESAVLVKVDGQWKVQLLHSTRLEDGKQPEGVDWELYEKKY